MKRINLTQFRIATIVSRDGHLREIRNWRGLREVAIFPEREEKQEIARFIKENIDVSIHVGKRGSNLVISAGSD
jgi:hypothetical protein